MVTTTSTASSLPSYSQDNHSLFVEVDSYPWSSDLDFQNGLAAILGSNPEEVPQEEVDDLTLRARTFFYERKFGYPVDFAAYKSWRATYSSDHPLSLSTASEQRSGLENSSDRLFETSPITADMPSGEEISIHSEIQSTNTLPPTEPQYPPSFQNIIELIQTGQPIPGIRNIPDTVLVGQGTESRKEQRQKPWEGRDAQQSSASLLQQLSSRST